MESWRGAFFSGDTAAVSGFFKGGCNRVGRHSGATGGLRGGVTEMDQVLTQYSIPAFGNYLPQKCLLIFSCLIPNRINHITSAQPLLIR